MEIQKMKNSLLLSLIFLALAGCKSGVTLPVSYTEVFGTPQVKTASLSIEVTSCKEYKTEMESGSVLQAKQKVGFVMAGAKYLGCKEEGFNSYALFDIPFTVGGVGVSDCKGDQICVATGQNDKSVNFFIGDQIRQKILQATQGPSTFSPEEFRITIAFDNNSGQKLPIEIPSLFVGENNKPFHALRHGELSAGTTLMTLSNVASAAAFSDGVVTAFDLSGHDLSGSQATPTVDGEKEIQTTQDMLNANGIEYEKADKRLNKIYQELMKSIKDPELKKKIRNEQRQWIKDRDKYCSPPQTNSPLGTIWLLSESSCRLYWVNYRADWLRELLFEHNPKADFEDLI